MTEEIKEKSVVCKRLLRTHNTVSENHRKSLIQHCKRSELRLHFGEFLKT